MADGNAAHGLGPYHDPGPRPLMPSALPADGIQDSSTLSDGDISRGFMVSAAAWDLDVLHPDDSFDLRTTGPAGHPVQLEYMPPEWQPPAFDQQHIHRAEPTDFTSRSQDPSPAFQSGAVKAEGHAGPGALTAVSDAPGLTPALEKELRSIAMPPDLRYGSPRSPSSPDSAKTGVASSPDASESSRKGARKRKVSAELEDDMPTDEPDKPVKKTAHNMIEKRYRTNINDKIAALRDSVPSLRIMSKNARGEDTTEDREELDGLTPAHKLNKATVLSKATEYIRHLEKRNNRLLEENGAMQLRLAAFEKLWMGGAMNGQISPVPQQPTPGPYAQNSQHFPPSSSMEPSSSASGMLSGLTDSTEGIERIVSSQMPLGQPYPMVSQQTRYPPGSQPDRAQGIQPQYQGQSGGWSGANPYLGKMMLSSLAGLMVLEAMRENEPSNSEPQGRGLFALPMQLLRHLPHSIDLRLLGYQHRLPIKFLLLIGLILWAYVPSLFSSLDSRPKKTYSGALQAAPSCAAPIATKRKAWLTSTQTVWVPHHNVFLEAAALMVKTAKLSIRQFFGDDAYRRLTGKSEEEEIGRIKAWTIALDSQLAGGDEGICRSRLLLTLLASGTLPDTPARLMLKALHIRLLVWGFSHPGPRLGMLDALAARLARTKWNKARQLNQFLIQMGHVTGTPHEDELPDHLAALLSQECDEVLNEMVVQRAHNLAWNKETSNNIPWPIEGMDAVVEDTAVTAPMDAVAAWWSTEILHDVLAASVDRDKDNGQASNTRAQSIETAIKVAPARSMAQIRAILARAVLTERTRGANIAAVTQAMNEGDGGNTDAEPPTALGARESGAYIRGHDSQLSLGCAAALAHLKRVQAGAPDSMESFREAVEKITLAAKMSSLTLLSFASVMEVVDQVLAHKKVAEGVSCRLEELVRHLRIWIGSPLGSKCGLGHATQESAVTRCLTITKSLLQMDHDPGYSSMSDGEDAADVEGTNAGPIRRSTKMHNDR